MRDTRNNENTNLQRKQIPSWHERTNPQKHMECDIEVNPSRCHLLLRNRLQQKCTIVIFVQVATANLRNDATCKCFVHPILACMLVCTRRCVSVRNTNTNTNTRTYMGTHPHTHTNIQINTQTTTHTFKYTRADIYRRA